MEIQYTKNLNPGGFELGTTLKELKILKKKTSKPADAYGHIKT